MEAEITELKQIQATTTIELQRVVTTGYDELHSFIKAQVAELKQSQEALNQVKEQTDSLNAESKTQISVINNARLSIEEKI